MDWDETPPEIKAKIRGACEAFRHGVDTARESIYKNIFTRIWFRYDQGQQFLTNWHHVYVGRVFFDVLVGNRVNVVVNQPPGSSKSEAWCIFLPALASVNFDRVRILQLSYSKALVTEHANRIKALLGSAEFQELWPRAFGRTNAENFTLLNEQGKVAFQVFSRSLGGQVTGARGGYMVPGYSGHIMLDDPQKPVDMLSSIKRESSNQMLINTVRSRRALPTTPVIIVQQRLHTEDASGFALSGKLGMDFDHVNIPALIDDDYLQSLPEDIRIRCWADIKDSPSRVVNGVRYWSYWPAKETVDDLVALWERDLYVFTSQYMQKPSALTGGIFETGWFQEYTHLPPLSHRAVYVDTNSGKVEDYHDYTVFTLVGVGRDDGNLYIIDSVRGRWDPEDLLIQARELWAKWRPFNPKWPMPLRHMGIEDKQAGQGLIVTLKKPARAGENQVTIPVKEIPRGTGQNKLVRALNCVPQIKGGKVFMPATHDEDGRKIEQVYYHDGTPAARTDWVVAAKAEFADFSADDSHDNDDIVDTIMDAIDQELIQGGGGSGFNWL